MVHAEAAQQLDPEHNPFSSLGEGAGICTDVRGTNTQLALLSLRCLWEGTAVLPALSGPSGADFIITTSHEPSDYGEPDLDQKDQCILVHTLPHPKPTVSGGLLGDSKIRTPHLPLIPQNAVQRDQQLRSW